MFQVWKIFVVLLLQTLLFSSFSHANFEKAMEIYRAGRFDEAKSAFEALAAIGDRSSLFNLGVMHYRGESFEKSPIKAYVLMKIANDGFDDESFTKISKSILGSFDDQQKKESEELFIELNSIYNISKIKANIFPKPLNDEDCPPEITPIERVAPLYPRSESIAGRMGLTQMEFTISPEGYPRDIIAAKSTNNAFTISSVKAAKKFLYKPPLDSKPIFGYRNVFIYQLVKNNGENMKVRTKTLSKELNDLKRSAGEGDAVAQYSYASRLNTFRYFKDYLEKIDLQYKTANEWFTKSAQSGLPHAQYEIGRNMLEGRGCEIDIVNGYKWINAAAIGGYSPAQNVLAQSALTKSDLSTEKSLAAIGWLRNSVQANNFPARLLLAWELSTSNISELRNAEEALELIESDPENYFDDVRIMETKAAAYAELGDFKKAKKYQKKAEKIARKFNWDIPLISDRLRLYDHGEPYRGTYY